MDKTLKDLNYAIKNAIDNNEIFLRDELELFLKYKLVLILDIINHNNKISMKNDLGEFVFFTNKI